MENIIKAIQENKATVIDVRSQMEFDMEHFPGALNIPLETVVDEVAKIGAMPKPIVVYCRSGNRSGMAKTILGQHGVTEVYNGGGIFDMMNIARN
jgi:phage shock protein E